MNYLVACFVAVVASVLAYIALVEKLADRIRLFNIAKSEEEFQSVNIGKPCLIVLVVAVGVMSFLSMLNLLKAENILDIYTMTLALFCMVGAGCFDLRQKRIPNLFPIVMLFGALARFGLSVALGEDDVLFRITSSAIGAAVCCVVLTLTAVLTKEGIGAGDIKLISALALMIGVYSVVETLFFAAVFCSLAAIVLLVIKRKDTSKSVPFGPFLLLGYIAMILMNNI